MFSLKAKQCPSVILKDILMYRMQPRVMILYWGTNSMHLLYGPNHRPPKQNTLSDLVYNSPTATVGGVTNYNGISCWEVQVVVHDCLTNGLRMSTRVSVTIGIYKIPCHLSKRVGNHVPVVDFLLVSLSVVIMMD